MRKRESPHVECDTPATATGCHHRWRLEPQQFAAHGVCALCGTERDFEGGEPDAFSVAEALDIPRSAIDRWAQAQHNGPAL